MSKGERVKLFLRECCNCSRIMGMRVSCIPPMGDCFYCAVEEAMNNANEFLPTESLRDVPDVSFLRNIVASSIDQTIFETYQLYWQSGVEGYEFMKHIIDLSQLKTQISKTSDEVGSNNCIWADHFAVQCISDFLSVSFLIFNEQLEVSTTLIHPISTKNEGEFIILYLTNRNHYDLIGWQNSASLEQYYFLYHQLPDYICVAFGLGERTKILQHSKVEDPDYHEETEDLSVWRLLSDEFLRWFFTKYFNEHERKFSLANVCDRWGRVIWHSFIFPPLFISKKKRSAGPKTEVMQDEVLQRPRSVLQRVSVLVPHLYSLISSVEITYFQRHWMEDILEIPNLKEFHFLFGSQRKYHLPNPDLKLLVKSKGKSLEKLCVRPQADNSLPSKFNKCGYNAIINHATRLKELIIDISSDINNNLIKGLVKGKNRRLPELEKLSLYGSENVTEEVLKELLQQLCSSKKPPVVELFHSVITNTSLHTIQETFPKIDLRLYNNPALIGKRTLK